MDAEIRPEPTADERRALLEALRGADDAHSPAASAWLAAALAAADDYEATARPPSSRGATRA